MPPVNTSNPIYLSSHLRPGTSSDLFRFPTKILYAFLIALVRYMPHPTHVPSFAHPNNIWYRTLRSRSCFVFGRSRVQILAPAILIEIFRGFLSPSRRMPGQYLKISPRPLPTKYFPIRYLSRITLSSMLYSLVTETAS
jgi:hypothetical protein